MGVEDACYTDTDNGHFENLEIQIRSFYLDNVTDTNNEQDVDTLEDDGAHLLP